MPEVSVAFHESHAVFRIATFEISEAPDLEIPCLGNGRAKEAEA
jgi:hypothetical protein